MFLGIVNLKLDVWYNIILKFIIFFIGMLNIYLMKYNEFVFV